MREAATRLRGDASAGYARGQISMREVRFRRAVADWLDSHAGDLKMAGGQLSSCDSPGDTGYALTIASAYLGEAESR